MKAMVLCAGYGTRLGELTREMPKPMLDVNGRPLLDYILANLARHGFTQVAINLHFQPEILRGHFGDGSKWGVHITWSEEPELLGTAGGVKRMQEFFAQEECFLVQYGDIVTDQDLGLMAAFHRRTGAIATVLVHERPRSNSVAVLDADSRIVAFLERPGEEERSGVTSRWVNSGICICSPEALRHIPAGRAADFPRDVFPRLIDTGRLYAFPLSGYRCAVDSPQRLAELREAVATGRCLIPSPTAGDRPPSL